ncbi:hypothetical protein [Streptomyces sp. MMG1121]|uniref:hypothetical protein n=1 Tax=Streptomyces sp. MMG1121 TaxID=1415544 RepID=UPI0006AF342B|nr:hypothetical protein [Streptomyces sp. MMG1121]KOV56207.1 hypothetical protein ADK64_41775 [Streptomyces sp. MMG1121]
MRPAAVDAAEPDTAVTGDDERTHRVGRTPTRAGAGADPATPRTLIERFKRDAAAAGPYNAGGPVPLSGGAADRFFSDATRHDHVHAGLCT